MNTHYVIVIGSYIANKTFIHSMVSGTNGSADRYPLKYKKSKNHKGQQFKTKYGYQNSALTRRCALLKPFHKSFNQQPTRNGLCRSTNVLTRKKYLFFYLLLLILILYLKMRNIKFYHI